MFTVSIKLYENEVKRLGRWRVIVGWLIACLTAADVAIGFFGPQSIARLDTLVLEIGSIRIPGVIALRASVVGGITLLAGMLMHYYRTTSRAIDQNIESIKRAETLVAMHDELQDEREWVALLNGANTPAAKESGRQGTVFYDALRESMRAMDVISAEDDEGVLDSTLGELLAVLGRLARLIKPIRKAKTGKQDVPDKSGVQQKTG